MKLWPLPASRIAMGSPGAIVLARWRSRAERILRAAEGLRSLSDEQLTGQARELAWQARGGKPLSQILDEVFALVCEAARRTVSMVPYPVQIMGGLALCEGRIAEMQTGEGKTLTATLPAALYAFPGKGCHVVTSNDYLAQRDAELMQPIYRALGLSVGCVQPKMEPDERRAAYHSDITYGTAAEFGFDFLRDRLQTGVKGSMSELPRYHMPSAGEGVVQRGHFFALIDEADHILIDEAVTPLIIGLPEPNTISGTSLLHWALSVVVRLEPDRDYLAEPDRKHVTLTEQGARSVLLAPRPRWLDSISHERILSQVETALAARLFYRNDREYVVHQNEITIVDESTGRMMEGRKWQHGLHQAMEVKEGVPVSEATHHAAQITIQSFFRRYKHLAGMTGTAIQSRREIKRVYRSRVIPIPTHRPCLRHGLPTRVFATDHARNRALVRNVLELVAQQRAVLIGTPSVSASEELGAMLAQAEVPHKILNARFLEEEAEIVSQAGQPSRVTIATNMAGRGTDIIPHDLVKERGGLHVIATAMHSAARIDRQLVGRTARQGDPGSFQFLLSMQDPLLLVLSPRQRSALQQRVAVEDGKELPANCVKYFRTAQRRLEKLNIKRRKQMLKHEQQQQDAFRRMGLDPYLECAGD